MIVLKKVCGLWLAADRRADMKKAAAVVLAIVALASLGGLNATGAGGYVVWDDLGKHFAGYAGTFVLYDEAKNQYIVCNEAQSLKRLSPCSTFKIYNSLIGLETGVVDRDDARTAQKWNGARHPIAAWNKDHTLASATRDSAVWYYQGLAARIGAERMREYLGRLDYGNCDISGGITEFWLDSSLKVSAREQVDLLRKLHSARSPFSARSLAIVRRNITAGYSDGAWVMGKTGSAAGGALGWYVGWVEKNNNRVYFAVNIEGEAGADGARARQIAFAILKELGVVNDVKLTGGKKPRDRLVAPGRPTGGDVAGIAPPAQAAGGPG